MPGVGIMADPHVPPNTRPVMRTAYARGTGAAMRRGSAPTEAGAPAMTGGIIPGVPTEAAAIAKA